MLAWEFCLENREFLYHQMPNEHPVSISMGGGGGGGGGGGDGIYGT